MEWETNREVSDRLWSHGHSIAEKAVSLFSLSTILRHGRMASTISQSVGLADACPTSHYASSLFASSGLMNVLSRDEVSLIALTRFYHRDFLIDINEVDLSGTMEIVDRMIMKCELGFPDRHGRTLYDRYLEIHPGRRSDFLSADEADTLTSGLDNGVYQVGKVVVGPLGLLLSAEARMLRPSRKVPLWHCSDAGCGFLHLVDLHSRDSKVKAVEPALIRFLEDNEGPASDWENAFAAAARPQRRQPYFEILAVLSDAFDKQERQLLIEEVLSGSHGKLLRETISARLGSKRGQGPAERVAAKLSDNQIVHLLSTLETAEIVRVVDRLIGQERISIPKSETRHVRTPIPKRTGDLTTSISSLGMRANKKEPASYLAQAIFNAFTKAGIVSELSWRCKANNATTASVLVYIAAHGPRKTVADLVMPSKQVFQHICDDLTLNPADLGEGLTEDHILWKAGFTISRYDNYLSLFRNSLKSFNEAIIAMPPKANDLDRETIRSFASNVFVYSERFLQDLISFTAWLLFSDHFGSNKFEYRVRDSLQSVVEVCGSPIDVGGAIFHWDSDGNNTLGALLVYGRKLSEVIAGLSQAEAIALRRLPKDYPHYASPTSVRFPFKHTKLWADANPDSISEYRAQFDEIVSILEKAKIAEIRNGLQHYRDPTKFPARADLLDSISLITAALDLADVGSFFPKQFWASQHTKDSYGISHWRMLDYNGRETVVRLPSSYTGTIEPTFAKAYIIEHGEILGPQSGKLLFVHKEASRYSALWDDFDRVTPVRDVSADDLDQ